MAILADFISERQPHSKNSSTVLCDNTNTTHVQPMNIRALLNVKLKTAPKPPTPLPTMAINPIPRGGGFHP